MALAKATTNKKHYSDPVYPDPFPITPYRQTTTGNGHWSTPLYLPRYTLNNPVALQTAEFFSRVPFVAHNFHGPVPAAGAECIAM